jgi:two-component system, cell cycle response regulator DivK
MDYYNIANIVRDELQFSNPWTGTYIGFQATKGPNWSNVRESVYSSKSILSESDLHVEPLPSDKIADDIITNEKINRVTFDGKPLILVAEDDEFNYFYLETILSKAHMGIIRAANGLEAVEQCYNHPEISLVLMDLKMPVMSGFEATRKVRSFRNDLPIIALTAFAMTEDKVKALEAGCDDYLTKPVSKEILLERINKFI